MTDQTLDASSSNQFRSGFCAIVGLPNVGKSTLLNSLVGERLSIVTHKAQTTRQRLVGIYSDDSHQVVFIDTPGLLEPRYLLQEAMQVEAKQAVTDADVLTYVMDAGFAPSVDHARAFETPPFLPALLCINKADRCEPREIKALQSEFGSRGTWAEVLVSTATAGRGTTELREAILSRLPHGPPLYPVDELATAPVRFFAAEFIRETCFEELDEEVPYSVAVEVEQFLEDREPVLIAALLHVERNSQKGIVIGRSGRMIRTIGERSRQKIEDFIGRPVYLDLRVKVLPNWRRRRGRLKLLGYHLPAKRG
jgi:GTP-binding protein Era